MNSHLEGVGMELETEAMVVLGDGRSFYEGRKNGGESFDVETGLVFVEMKGFRM